MEKVKQEQAIYEVSPAVVGDLVKELTYPSGDGVWDGDPVPTHILGISIAPHEEKAGMLMVIVIHLNME